MSITNNIYHNSTIKLKVLYQMFSTNSCLIKFKSFKLSMLKLVCEYALWKKATDKLQIFSFPILTKAAQRARSKTWIQEQNYSSCLKLVHFRFIYLKSFRLIIEKAQFINFLEKKIQSQKHKKCPVNFYASQYSKRNQIL